MKFNGTLITVKDIDKAVKFYSDVMGLSVICDFGANKTLTGDLSLQTLDTWKEFINVNEEDIILRNNAMELYFEEDDIDSFAKKLEAFPDIEYVHVMKEYPWGQRCIRFYDADKHIIEVGENMDNVVMRFLKSGMNNEEIASRMDVPIEYIDSVINSLNI